mgnify:CR=1 FL=1
MKKHHTKSKGDLGVLKAQVDLFEQGYLPLLPQTEHASFDLVGYRDGIFKRIQVKYRSVDKTGKLEVHFRSSWADKNGNHLVSVDKNEVDLYCVYCPDTDVCYWFDPKKFNNSVCLRVEIPKNNQNKNVNLASDYRRVP